jgi:hypothetical protein
MEKLADAVTAHTTGEWAMGKYTGCGVSPTHDEIAQLAFSLYESRGRRRPSERLMYDVHKSNSGAGISHLRHPAGTGSPSHRGGALGGQLSAEVGTSAIGRRREIGRGSRQQRGGDTSEA